MGRFRFDQRPTQEGKTMTTLYIEAPMASDAKLTDEALDRISGCVCTNGSQVKRNGRCMADLVFPDDRREITPTEAATFVRNFLDEGFDDTIVIT